MPTGFIVAVCSLYIYIYISAFSDSVKLVQTCPNPSFMCASHLIITDFIDQSIPLGFIPVPNEKKSPSRDNASLRGPFSCHRMITKHIAETFRKVGVNLSGPTTTTHLPENQRCRNTSISPGFPTSSHDGTQTISPFIRTFTENTGLGLQKLIAADWG